MARSRSFEQWWHRRRLVLDDGRVLSWTFIDDPRALRPHVAAARIEGTGPLHPEEVRRLLAAAGHRDAAHVPAAEVGIGRFH